jgi:maltooligosyltrehalose trehalohydrolase
LADRTEEMGATLGADGLTEFRVWAPYWRSMSVEVAGRSTRMTESGDGVFSGILRAGAGDDYWFVLEDGLRVPDPCSRWQPGGLRGPSRVLDTNAFPWSAEPVAAQLDDLVIYELHVGTFTPEGTFDAVIPRLAELADLGVTAIELMPVATFPGNRGWGYDGVLTWAPHVAYGGPEGLARLVDAAHRHGLGVLLDVVYNHIGPGSELVSSFGPYFTHRASTPWGDALDYRRRGVREWAIQNAELWIRDYRIDGLRLDAVQEIHDESATHVLRELRDRVKAINPRALVISEIGTEDGRPLAEWGHDAIWLDSFHHELHVLLTGERDGYYTSFGSLEGLARDLTRFDPKRFVVFAQNHDQIGNRPVGDRLSPAEHRVALAVALFSAATPLLFMGEEYDESRPFLFFTDHDDAAIATATSEGRRREFAALAGSSGDEIPDPQSAQSFHDSKLAPRTVEPLYRDLIALRRTLPHELRVESDGRKMLLHRGDATLAVDFDAKTVGLSL